jgi:hypothetical protein
VVRITSRHIGLDAVRQVEGFHGRLSGAAWLGPALDSTDEVAVTEPMAKAFGLHPGSHMTWQFYRLS